MAELAGERVRLRFRDFLRVGIPVTLLSTAWGVAVLWLYQGKG